MILSSLSNEVNSRIEKALVGAGLGEGKISSGEFLNIESSVHNK